MWRVCRSPISCARWPTGRAATRKFGGIMIAIAKTATEAEIKDAANYFASVKPRQWIRVVEADTVPKSFIGPGNKRLVHPGRRHRADGQPHHRGAGERGGRGLPRSELRIRRLCAQGQHRQGRGAGHEPAAARRSPAPSATARPCRALGDVPALAGRHPNYIVRQLWNIQNGDRAGPSAALMQPGGREAEQRRHAGDRGLYRVTDAIVPRVDQFERICQCVGAALVAARFGADCGPAGGHKARPYGTCLLQPVNLIDSAAGIATAGIAARAAQAGRRVAPALVRGKSRSIRLAGMLFDVDFGTRLADAINGRPGEPR